MSSVSPTPSIAERPEPERLSWTSFGLLLGLLLGVFVLLNPIWEQQDMGAWNENIWWSYLPIPLLVAGLLRLEGKFSWPGLGLETMKLTFVKFILTITIATVIWEFQGTPGTGRVSHATATDAGVDGFEPQPAPLPSALTPGQLGGITGAVTDAQGHPVPGALVYIFGGLEALTFEVPQAPFTFTNDGSGFSPDTAVLRAHQNVNLHSASEDLHTAVFKARDSRTGGATQRLLNFPLIPRGERSLMFDRELGYLTLTCSVHGEAEPAAQVLVLQHPFWTITDEMGAFVFDAVPALELELSVERIGAQVHQQSLIVGVGPPTTLAIQLTK